MRHSSLFYRGGSTVWKWSVLTGVLGALFVLSAGLLSLVHTHGDIFISNACTLVGAEAGVSLYIPRTQIDVERGVTADITVNGQDYHLKADHFLPEHRPGGVSISFSLPDDTPAGEVKLRIVFTSTTGTEQTLVHTAPLELVEPNGPNCEPHVYQFNSVIHEGQFLTYEEWDKADPQTVDAESMMDRITLSLDGISDDAIPHK